jgi:hypothetical protein
MEVSGQLHFPAALPPGLVGWVGPRAVLDAVVKRKIPRYLEGTSNKITGVEEGLFESLVRRN